MPIETFERDSGRLISSDKVDGTAVYSNGNEKVGSIKCVMIDKTSGHVSYAVLSFGGFLGIGENLYPLPWNILKYDTKLGGYKTGLSADRLKGAPKYGESEMIWDWSDPAKGKMVDDYYA